MDYAKYAYIKTTELELAKMSDNHSETQRSRANAIEFNSGIMNMSVTGQSDITCGKVHLYGDVFFQNKVIIEANAVGKILVEILLDDVAILAEERTLVIGQNEIILMKTYDNTTITDANISIRIKIVSNSYACEVINNVLAAWGSVEDTLAVENIQMRAIENNDKLLVSYTENNKLYVATTDVKEKSFAADDFQFVASGISHCFAKDKQDTLYLFRVDDNGNLFYSKYSNVLNETKIDENVSVVYASKCISAHAEDILVCYIKNGVPMFRCITNGVFGSATNFDVPSGKYVDIEIADAEDADRMFVICTHSNLSNYIVHSVKEDTISGFSEILNASVAVEYTKYLRYETAQTDGINETLKAAFCFYTKKVLADGQEYLNNKMFEKLNAKVLYQSNLYTISNEEYNYELSYNQKETYVSGANRVKYGGDCADWIPATADLTGVSETDPGGIIDPSGILNKWPFNKIRPCLVKNGELVGYLNPEDYSLFEDGTAADITNAEYDVMVEFPKIYYKIEHDWDGICKLANCKRSNIKVYVTNVYKEGYACLAHTKGGVEYDSIYIGAYECFYRSAYKNIVCCSDVITTCQKTHEELLRTFYDYRDSQYQTFHYHVVTMIQILSLLLFGEYNGRTIMGNGIASPSPSNVGATGYTNQKGMFYCYLQDGSMHHKLFGLEDLLGSHFTVIDGLLTDESLNYMLYDPTNPNCILSYAGENYKTVTFSGIGTRLYNYLEQMAGDTSYGFLPISAGTMVSAGTPYYNASTYINPPSRYTSSIDTTNKPYMIYLYSAAPTTVKYQSVFSYFSAYQKVEGSFYAERLVCYPADKMS